MTENVYELKINKGNLKNLLKVLKRYDYENSPKKIVSNGKITYIYKRLLNAPPSSVEELERLIKNPINTKKHEQFIKKSFLYLLSNGVEIHIKKMKKQDPSAQWRYKDKNIIINEKSLKDGTINFAYLLSHEMIHVSQSCKGGDFDQYPTLLGLKINKPKNYYYENLKSHFYEDLKENEIMLEVEAYANQKEISQTLRVFKFYCLK